MPADKWWKRQLLELMKEASLLYEAFLYAKDFDIDDLDKAQAIFQACYEAYNFTEMTFEEFVEFGRNLRARRVSPLMEI